jgi:hypothetical protein
MKLRLFDYSKKRESLAACSLLVYALSALMLLAGSFLINSAPTAYSAQAELTWDPPAGTLPTELAGYRVHYGTASRDYSNIVDVGNVTDYVVANLDAGSTYYFAVTALGTDGSESAYSNEASKTLAQQFVLTVNTGGSGAGTITSSPSGINCTSSCAAMYNAGTIVTLTATPTSGSTFTGWSGGTCSGTGLCSISLSASMSDMANFSAATYSISGKVMSGRKALSRVTLTLGGDSNSVTITDRKGNYTFEGLASGTYTITPAETGYTFSPNGLTVTVSNADITGQDFKGEIIPTCSISGKVMSGRKALSRVTLTLGGDSNSVTITDRKGNYTFNRLISGTYTITPAITGYTFSPSSRTVTVSSTNVLNQNFTTH